MWNKLINAAADFVYPPECCLCLQAIQRKKLSKELHFKPELCEACQNNLPKPIENGCVKCGAPSGPFVDTSTGCIYCRDDHLVFKETYAFGIYRGEIKRVCLLMKNPAHKFLTMTIGQLLVETAKLKIEAWQPDFVVSVPSRKLFPWSMGNPAPEILASIVAKEFKLKLHLHVIKKIKSTAKQTRLSPTDRKKNLRQAYKVAKSKNIVHKKILLVDDTMTTGSTVNEVSKELIFAGASAVYVLVFSRGIGLNIDN